MFRGRHGSQVGVGKLNSLDERGDETWLDHAQVVIAVRENEPEKLNQGSH